MGGELLVLAYVAMLFIVIGSFIYLKRKPAPVVEEDDALPPNANPAARGARAAPPRARDRMQRLRQQVNARAERKLGGEDEDEPDSDGEDAKRQQEMKRRNELQDKAAKEAAREAKRKERYEAFEAAERAAAEAAAAIKAEKERKQKEEEDWKTPYSAETGSSAIEDMKNNEGLLKEFVAYIQKRKVVAIEDIAAEFKIRSLEAVARIKALEEAGTITGVLDDRGRFILVTPSELDSVAEWIKQTGRMTIQEVAAECNRRINLTLPETNPLEPGES